MAEKAAAAAPQRGTWLTIWLVLVFLGGIFSLFSYLTGGMLLASAAVWPAWVTPAYIVTSILVLVAAYGIWTWKQWGLTLYYVALVANVIISGLAVGSWVASILGGLVAGLIMYFSTKSYAANFK